MRVAVNLVKNLSKFWIRNNYKITLLVVMYLLILALTNVPYLNLILTPYVIAVLIYLLVAILFKINGAMVMKFSILLFLFAFLFQIVGLAGVAEKIGDGIYLSLLYGILLIVRNNLSGR